MLSGTAFLAAAVAAILGDRSSKALMGRLLRDGPIPRGGPGFRGGRIGGENRRGSAVACHSSEGETQADGPADAHRRDQRHAQRGAPKSAEPDNDRPVLLHADVLDEVFLTVAPCLVGGGALRLPVLGHRG
jgi:hypothetical protein